MGHEPNHGSEATRVHRFELDVRYDRRAETDPSRWRFTLSDTASHERVGGVGLAGLAEAVALLTSRVPSGRRPSGSGVVES